MTQTVLILDDDPDFRKLLTLSLKEEPWLRILEASTGNEANFIIETEKPDLIIVDGHLPDTEGLKWIKGYRTAGGKASIIFLTGSAQAPAVQKKLLDELGVVLSIEKPSNFNRHHFAEIVRSQFAKDPNFLPTPVVSQDDGRFELMKQYAENLPSRIVELEQAIQKVKSNSDNQLLVKSARQLAHKLVGTAGSYGFVPVGEAARKIENALLSLNTKAAEDVWQIIDSAISEARTNSEPKSQPAEVIKKYEVPNISSTVTARVLVVDDDNEILNLFAEFGKRRLVEVVCANTVTEAIEKASRVELLDGAFLDVQLGADDNPFELAREIREIPGCENLPLVFMTANPHIYNQVAAAHAGASLYLTKPLDFNSIESALQHMASVSKANKPRILAIDDDDDLLRLIELSLTKVGIQVFTLNDPVRILDVLHELSPDLLLLDVLMPGVNGFDLCRSLRTNARWRDLPVIFLTAANSPDLRVAAYKSGADDYLLKPFIEEELISRVKVRVERGQLAKERSDKDPITGLWLRRSYLEQLNAMIYSAKRHNFPVTIALIDIDNFKIVNNTKGPLSGDVVLSGIGRLILHRFRTEDLRGRWGGDEFMITFHQTTTAQAYKIVERFTAELSSLLFSAEDGSTFKVTCSVGIANYPEDSEDINGLIAVADRRLIANKSGRNQNASLI